MPCSHCNSANHLSFDCPKQSETYVQSAADLEQAAVQEPPPQAPKEPEPVFELGPERFRGCPPICSSVNLPAHDSESAAWAFHERFAPRCKVLKVGKCKACGKWHVKSQAPAPAGETSGSTRDSRLPPGFVPFQRLVRESSFAGHGGTAELPQREAEAVADVPKRLEAKPNRALQSKPLGGLFK